MERQLIEATLNAARGAARGCRASETDAQFTDRIAAENRDLDVYAIASGLRTDVREKRVEIRTSFRALFWYRVRQARERVNGEPRGNADPATLAWRIEAYMRIAAGTVTPLELAREIEVRVRGDQPGPDLAEAEALRKLGDRWPAPRELRPRADRILTAESRVIHAQLPGAASCSAARVPPSAPGTSTSEHA